MLPFTTGLSAITAGACLKYFLVGILFVPARFSISRMFCFLMDGADFNAYEACRAQIVRPVKIPTDYRCDNGYYSLEISGGHMLRIKPFILLGLFVSLALAGSMTVAYNTNSVKYHRLGCKWAARCTQNCIEISIEEAIKRGGVPCRVCKPRK